MNLPQAFEKYVQQGIIIKCSINKPRAEFLMIEAEKSFKGVNKRVNVMGIDEENSNSIIKDCYDIMMEVIRAKLLLTGYCSAGQFAHEAEISYLKKCEFSDYNISFMNEVRYFRNSITYYGKILTVEYARQVFEFTTKMYPKLKNI